MPFVQRSHGWHESQGFAGSRHSAASGFHSGDGFDLLQVSFSGYGFGFGGFGTGVFGGWLLFPVGAASSVAPGGA